MGSLAGKSQANTYKSLLKVADETNGVSAIASQIQDGEGTNTCMAISDDVFVVQPQNDNTATTVLVKNAAGDRIFSVDTSNTLIKIGSTSTPANSQILEFHARNLIPASSGTHYFISRPDASYFGSAVETSMGTGTDPDTSLDAGATTDDL